MSAGRVLLLVFGSLATLIAIGLLAAGGVLLWLHTTKRDADGFYTTRTDLATPTYALTSEGFDIADVEDWPFDEGTFAEVRLRGTSIDPERELFIGIGPEAEVGRYLARVEHDEIVDIDFHDVGLDEATVDYRRVAGARTPDRPAAQDFWEASVEGSGTQTLDWELEEGRFAIVVMDAAAEPGVEVDMTLGARVPFVVGLAIGLLVGGVLLLAGGITMLYFGARSRMAYPAPASAASETAYPSAPPPAPTPAGALPAPAVAETAATAVLAGPVAAALPPQTYPVAVEGELDEPLSRGLWLAKWLLAVPHYLILAFLWLAFVVLTVGAFFAILFTGRYPRGIFEFNVGVMRWSWRVAFYSYSALATDRYPPFTLADDPAYPARLDVEYPEQLSRGLVLVKWWLLAIPHYLIVGLLVGTGLYAWQGDGWWVRTPSVAVVLAVVAGVVLLFRGRYPRDVFDLLVGLYRWAFRVAAYVLLLRDEYPPFRLGR